MQLHEKTTNAWNNWPEQKCQEQGKICKDIACHIMHITCLSNTRSTGFVPHHTYSEALDLTISEGQFPVHI